MAKLLEYNATLAARIDLEPTLAIFQVKPDLIERRATEDGPWFVPGQYVTIGLNRGIVEGEDDPRPVSVRRPMSIASPPEVDDIIEFYIRRVSTPESNLPLTHLMWPLEVGERMYCRSVATGKFTVKDTVGEEDPRLKVTVAAGTGLAPFVCMLRSRLHADPKADLSDFAILHGASYPTSLGYREELEKLARENGLKYLPTISRPADYPDWSNFTGRVEALFEPDKIAQTEEALGLPTGGLTPKNATVLICGLQGTIANTIIHLLGRGFIPDHRRLRRGLEVPDDAPAHVFWEQYDTTPVIDIKDEPLMKDLRARLRSAL